MQDEYRSEQDSAAIGAAIGMMFAPKPGAETRQQLADQTDRFRRRATEQADRLRRRATDAYNDASQTINDVVSRGREALDVGREAFQRARPNGASGEPRSSMP
jgi:gas vesicle protein